MKERQSGKDELHLDFIEYVRDKRTPADIAYEQWLKKRDAQFRGRVPDTDKIDGGKFLNELNAEDES